MKNKSIVAVLIALIVISSISVIGISAVSGTQVNVLSAKLPVIFGSANYELFELNGSKVRFKSSGSSNMQVGYDTINAETKSAWSNKLCFFTDGNETTGQYLRPENSADNDRVILVYRFLKSDIKSFSISIEGTKRKSFSVYLSESLDNLYSGDPVYFISKNKNNQFSYELENEIRSFYLAIVLESPDYVIDEIALTGTVVEDSDSVISNLNPTMYASAKAKEFNYNWFEIHYGNGADDKKHGYSEIDITGFADFWNGYTNKLTDGDIDSYLYIKPEVKSGNDRIIAVYSLSSFYDLTGYSIKFGNGIKNFSIYLSKERGSLFESMPVSDAINFSYDIYSDGFESIRAKYIGIVFEKPDLDVFEISFYGKKFVPAQKGENVIANMTPVIYASTNKDAFAFNWSQTYYENEKMKHGYDNKGNGYKDFWQEYVERLTDKNKETELFIKAERTWNNDNVMAVYNFDDSVINGLSIVSNSDKRKVIDVYASTSLVDLFDEPICRFDSYGKEMSDDGSIEIRAKYVGIVFVTPSYAVSEIEINANPYQRPDYGTNLLLNKLPQRFFIANRTYPLVPTSDEIIDIWKTNDSLGLATDGDFKTTVNWKPSKAKSQVNANTRYLVFSYDLGGNSNVEKILIDSGLGGFDIYISDDYFDLFEKTENKVYTSNGDKLDISGQELDKSTNLTPGEKLIEFNKPAKGRYIGIVVTRAQPVGRECWEIVNITEFQVFGTSDSISDRENLIANQAPIMCYRAKNSDYSKSIGQMSSPNDMKRYTDGNLSTGAEIQFPNTSGYINYDYGSLVMIYYLQGSSSIDYFYEDSVIYYGIGGVDVFAAEKFADLFKEENLMFTTHGTDADDGVYDHNRDLGAKGISGYFDGTKTGRYIAFVFTRVSDSVSKGWGIVRLCELKVVGSRPELEVLPNTTLTDKTSGATATFEYVNPDDKFDFATKGISEFRINYLNPSDYLSSQLKYSLGANGYSSIDNAFKIEFYGNGKKISSSSLEGEKIRLKLKLNNSEVCFLSEIRDNNAYLIKDAVKQGSVIDLLTEEFDKTYLLLKYKSTSDFDINLSDGSVIINLDPIDDYYDDYSDYEDYDTVYVNDEEKTDSSTEDSVKKNKNRWKIVIVNDPMQWFWDTYDTFATNIWMPILCGVTAITSIVLIILAILFYKKRRKQQ